MATSQDIITRALTRLTILHIGGTPSAAMSKHGLDALNDMIDSWTARGVAVDPTIPIPAQHRPAMIALLAVRLAPDYGAAAVVSPELAKEAADGWFSLQAAYITAPDAQFETALQEMPSQRRLGITIAD